MRTIARLVATTSVLFVVAACGSAPSGGDSSSPSPTSAQDSGSAASSVVSVTLHRTGGLKPIEVDRTFSADATPPPGFSQQQVDAIITAADQLAGSSTTMTRMPANICCDRYIYTIIVTYADGTSKTISTADGVKQSAALAALLSDMM